MSLLYRGNVPWLVACVASVPVRAKCYVPRASEDSSRAKIVARAKKEKVATWNFARTGTLAALATCFGAGYLFWGRRNLERQCEGATSLGPHLQGLQSTK